MILKRILLATPLLIAIGYIIDCWADIINNNFTVRWQHVAALVFLATVIYCYVTNFKRAVVATGAFLVLGTFRAFSLTSGIETTRFRVGPITSPTFNFLCFKLLLLYLLLNAVTIINVQLDHQEMKNKK